MTKTLIIVPMKDPAASKTRLAGTLSEAARARLVKLLYQRSLAFLAPIAAESGADLAVVTAHHSAAAIAQRAGVKVIGEPQGAGLSGALSHAAGVAKAQGYDRLCVVPADLVAPIAADLQSMLASTAEVTLCPSADLGTNALLVSPPDAIPFRYGVGSARLHMQEAETRGLTTCLMPMDSLSFDVDTSACLARAIQTSPDIAKVCA